MKREQSIPTGAFSVKPVLGEYFQISTTQGSVYFEIATDYSLETSLQVFGQYLRNQREGHLNGKKALIPANLAVTACVKSLNSQEQEDEKFQSYFHGLICCEVKAQRGWHRKVIFSSVPDQKLEVRLDTPTRLSLNPAAMLVDYRFFAIGPTGVITEQLVRTLEQLDTLFAQRQEQEQQQSLRIPGLEDTEKIIEILEKKPVDDNNDRSTMYKTTTGIQDHGNLTNDNVSLSLSNASSGYQRMHAQYEFQIKSYQMQFAAFTAQLQSKTAEIDELKAQVALLMAERPKPSPSTKSVLPTANVERMEEEKYCRSESNGEQRLDFLSSSQKEGSAEERNSSLGLITFGDGNFEKDLEQVKVQEHVAPDYLRHRQNSPDYEENKEDISHSLGSDESFLESYQAYPVKKVKTSETQRTSPVCSQGMNATSDPVELKNSQESASVNIYTRRAHKKREENLFSKEFDWTAQLSNLKEEKDLSPELIDAYLSLKYPQKERIACCIFPASLWQEIETGTIFPAFSIFEHKPYLIFPMGLKKEKASRGKDGDSKDKFQWVATVIQKKSRSWHENPEIAAYYYDSSCPRYPSEKILPKILEALSNSVFKAKPDSSSKLSNSLLRSIPNLINVSVQKQKSPSVSGVHMLYHIDQVCSNPLKWLNEKLQDVTDILKKYKSEIPQVLGNHWTNPPAEQAVKSEQKTVAKKKSKAGTKVKNQQKDGTKQPVQRTKKNL